MMKPKVLFIGGYGRSGTTLLDRILGQIDGFFSAGEIRFLSQHALAEDRLCGCGRAFSDCGLWTEILERAYGDRRRIDPAEQAVLRERMRNSLGRSLTAAGRNSYRESVERYAELLGPLYPAIAEASGARVIVDSSKEARHGWLLDKVDSIDLRIIHLVRDPRAVAYSWQRRKFDPGSGDELPRFGLLKSGLEWNLVNSLTRLLGRRGARFMVLRYEDLVADPASAIERVLDLTDETGAGVPISDDRSIELGLDHTVAGNPMRFRQGEVRIEMDAEWKRRMRAFDRALVSTLTLPGLLRYGFVRDRPSRRIAALGDMQSESPRSTT
jgi:hypothetical protein